MKNIKWHEVTWYSRWGAITLFLVVVPVLAFVVGMKYQEVKNLEQTIGVTANEQPNIQQDFGNVSFSQSVSTATSSNIEIKISIPRISFEKNNEAEAKINNAINQELEKIRVTYEDAVSQMPCQNSSGEGCKSSIDIMATTSISKRLGAASVEFDIFVASEGMAHPSLEREKALHFDLRTGDQKSYFEILGRDKTELLNKLSAASRERLSDTLNINQNSPAADTFEKGTAPLEDNFDHVLIHDEGLTVNFAEYQLGPRPVGAPSIFVNYKELD
jgi:hypothetical protein